MAMMGALKGLLPNLRKLVIEDISPKALEYSISQAYLECMSREYDSLEALKAAMAAAEPIELMRNFIMSSCGPVDGPSLQDGKWRFRIPISVVSDSLFGYRQEWQALTESIQSSCPTLFIQAGMSDYISEADKDLINMRFPNSTIKAIPNASHWAHFDHPEEFLSLCLEFLQ